MRWRAERGARPPAGVGLPLAWYLGVTLGAPLLHRGARAAGFAVHAMIAAGVVGVVLGGRFALRRLRRSRA